MVPDGAGLGWVPDGPHPSTRILAVTHVQDFAEARRDPLVHGAQSQVEEVRRQGTALRDSFGGLDGTHRALRIRDVQIVRPIVEGPDKRPTLREAVGSPLPPAPDLERSSHLSLSLLTSVLNKTLTNKLPNVKR